MRHAFRAHHLAMLLAVGFLAAGPHARAADDAFERLASRFNQLASDPDLGNRAPAALDRARAALMQLRDARRSEREHWAYVAERRIDTARATAEAARAEDARNALQRDSDRLQLELARRDAAQARAELERQRLQAQIRAEEAERLRQQAEAARTEGEQALESARAEAEQARRMAAAQARAAALAKKEAELSAALQDGDKVAPRKKPKGK